MSPWLIIPAMAVPMAVLVASMAVILAVPDKWDKATVIGACGGLPILRLNDGTVWLRVSGMRVYRIENPDKLACK